jgi:hypothetical protein
MSDDTFHEQILEHHAKRGDWHPMLERLKMLAARRSADAYSTLVKEVVKYAEVRTLRPVLDVIVSTEKDATFIENVPKRIVTEGYLRQMASGDYRIHPKEWLNDRKAVMSEYSKFFTDHSTGVFEEFVKQANALEYDFEVIAFAFSASALEIVIVPKDD